MKINTFNTFKSIAILIAICFLSFGMISSSQADITSLSADASPDWGYGGYVGASLTADEDIMYIDWYIDDKFVKTTMHSNGTRSVYASLDTRTGEIKGVKYEVKAMVYFLYPNYDTATDDVKVFKPVWLWQVGENTGAYGYAEISRFYYDGSQIIMDALIYAHNPTNNPKAQDPENYPLSVLPWFWTQKYPAPNGNAEDERRDTKSIEIIQLGKTSQTYNPGPLTDPDPVTGERKPFTRNVGTIRKDNPVYYKAHAHLQVFDGRNPADNWEVDTQHQTGTAAVTFTWKDGP